MVDSAGDISYLTLQGAVSMLQVMAVTIIGFQELLLRAVPLHLWT